MVNTKKHNSVGGHCYFMNARIIEFSFFAQGGGVLRACLATFRTCCVFCTRYVSRVLSCLFGFDLNEIFRNAIDGVRIKNDRRTPSPSTNYR